jgi:hypothetical protein
MASILKVDSMQGVTSAGDITITSEGGAATMQLQQGLAKTWIDIDGSSSGAPARDSFNVSGTTDNGTGDYTTSFSSSKSNASYCVTYRAGVSGLITAQERQKAIATGSWRLEIIEDGSSARDSSYVHISINGDLA